MQAGDAGKGRARINIVTSAIDRQKCVDDRKCRSLVAVHKRIVLRHALLQGSGPENRFLAENKPSCTCCYSNAGEY